MFDAPLRRLIDPTLNRAAFQLSKTGISANWLTGVGAVTGVAAAVSIGQQQYIAALALIALNRLLDGLDGAVARVKGTTELGGYLDSLADFLFYVSVPVGFAFADADDRLAALLLLASFTLTAVSFLALAAIVAKRGDSDCGHGPKALVYTAGLMEGGETIGFFVLFCLLPGYFAELALLFAALCMATVAQRIAYAIRMLR
jgi:phosphatidylglycerophosphate synthase